ncbi:MAG: DUF45 domain-containing protein [Candidatus Omnitrophica bacterium]|nr:DUF45 domain-containing protein [Candidatus Omnitrophota bacterium]
MYKFTVERGGRRKTVAVIITPENKIQVKIPRSFPEGKIPHILEKKRRWIEKTFRFNREVRRPYVPKRFLEGERFLFLGSSYGLRFAAGEVSPHIDSQKNLLVYLPEERRPDRDFVQKEVSGWYREQARRVLIPRCAEYARRIRVAMPDIRIKSLTRSWGRCSAAGKISFAWNIVMAPLFIVDYIVVHELCHLQHLNHSPRFWREVAAYSPRFRECREWIRVHQGMLRF